MKIVLLIKKLILTIQDWNFQNSKETKMPHKIFELALKIVKNCEIQQKGLKL